MTTDFQLTGDEIRQHFNSPEGHSLRLQVEEWGFADVEALNCGQQVKEADGWVVVEKRSAPVPFLKVVRRGLASDKYPDIMKLASPNKAQ